MRDGRGLGLLGAEGAAGRQMPGQHGRTPLFSHKALAGNSAFAVITWTSNHPRRSKLSLTFGRSYLDFSPHRDGLPTIERPLSTTNSRMRFVVGHRLEHLPSPIQLVLYVLHHDIISLSPCSRAQFSAGAPAQRPFGATCSHMQKSIGAELVREGYPHLEVVGPIELSRCQFWGPHYCLAA